VKVVLTGARGMLGSSIREAWLRARPQDELVGLGRADVDLRDAGAVRSLLADLAPGAVIHAAARVGGIGDKLAHPTGYLHDNLAIDVSVIAAALEASVGELLYIGSAAIYPESAPQPIVASALLEGPLEGANEPYALAKLTGAKLCEYAAREHGVAYRVAVPSNLYGIHDHFDLGSAHLVAAALAKVHAARAAGSGSVEVWGDGSARREFTFASDLAGWLVGQVGHLSGWPDRLNLGAGVDHTIAEYYEVAADVVGFTGDLQFDATKPAGVARRLLDSGPARALGWNPPTSLRDGMSAVYAQFLSTQKGSSR
jgi:GDP-L-fucose synthase